MLKGLYTGWSGMVNEQNRMDVLTNNLANVTTVGFKKEGTTSQSFDNMLTVRLEELGDDFESVRRIGSAKPGVKIGENYTDWTQGSFRETGHTFDFAIAGEGFFALEFTNKKGETNTLYTRAGEFTLNKDGFLVNNDGDYLLDENSKRIQLNTALDTVLMKDGTLTQDGQIVAKVGIKDFEDYDYLAKYGENFYVPLTGAKFTDANAEIYQGYLEQSNVSVVNEMVNMITISRQYESNQKIVQTYDSSLEIAVKELGKI